MISMLDLQKCSFFIRETGLCHSSQPYTDVHCHLSSVNTHFFYYWLPPLCLCHAIWKYMVLIICQWLKTWGVDCMLYSFCHCVVSYFWSEAFILQEAIHMCPPEVIPSPVVKGHDKRQALSCLRTPLGNACLVSDVRPLMGQDVVTGQISAYMYKSEN